MCLFPTVEASDVFHGDPVSWVYRGRPRWLRNGRFEFTSSFTLASSEHCSLDVHSVCVRVASDTGVAAVTPFGLLAS